MATEKNFKVKNGISIGDDEVISSVRRFYASNGTVSKAAFSFDGESSTGMYKYGSNQIGFTAGGNLMAYIQSGATYGLVVQSKISATGGNSDNWNTAYGWGDHSTAGYLVSDGDGSDLQDVRAETVEVNLKNVSGSSIAKGTPVHQTGTSGTATFEVVPALAGTASTMPAHFIAGETLANQAEGRGILMGRISGVDTSSFSEGDTIYVGASGGFTNSAPTGEGNQVQNLGTVTKVHATNGGGEVYGAGRSNATPNLNNGNIFIGNGSNQAVTASLSTSVSGLSHYNNTNWDTAYSWGDHSTQGYLTSADVSGYLTSESDTLDSVTGRGNTTTNAISTGTITTSGNVIFDDGQITSDGTALIIDGANAKEVEIKSARDIRLVIDDNNDDTNNQFELYKHSVTSGNELLIIDQSGNMTASNNITADGSFITSTAATAVGIYAGATQILEGSTRNLKNLGTISSGAITSTGTGTFNALTLTGGSDNLTFTETGGDWSILNAQQNNGLVIYDGTGGLELHYNGSAVASFNSVDTTFTQNITHIGTLETRKLRIDRYNQTALVFEDGGGSDSVVHTLNDGQGNYNIMLNVNDAGQTISDGDGQAKILMEGHGLNGSVSLNAGPIIATAGTTANYSVGLLVNGQTNDIRVGNPNNNIGLAPTSTGYTKVFDNAGNAFAANYTSSGYVKAAATSTGGFYIGGTEIIEGDTRNIINIGTIGSGSITSSGNITAGSGSGFITAGTTSGYVYAKSLRLNNGEVTDTDFQFAYQMIVDANDTDSDVPSHGNISGSDPFGVYFLGDDGDTAKTLGNGLVKLWHTGHFTKAHIDHFVGLQGGTQSLTAPSAEIQGTLTVSPPTSGHTVFELGSRAADPLVASEGSYDFKPGMRVIASDGTGGTGIDADDDIIFAWNDDDHNSSSEGYLSESETYATASFSKTFTITAATGARFFAKVKMNDAESVNDPRIAVNGGTEYKLEYLDAVDAAGEATNDTDSWHVIDITDDVVTGSNTFKAWLASTAKTYIVAIYIFKSTGIMLPNEPYETVAYSHKGFGVGDTRIVSEDRNLINIGTISSGNITSSGTVTANSVVVNGIERIESDGDVIANNLTVAGNFTMTTGSIGVNGNLSANFGYVLAGTSSANGYWVGSNQIVEGDTRNLKNIGTIASGDITITGDFPRLYFVDTAGSDLDAYIVNNANGLFFGKTNTPSASNDILALNLSNKSATFSGTISSGAITSTDSSSFGDVAIGGAADSNYDLKVYGLARFEGAANFVDATNPIQVGGQTIIDASRNLTNIGGISASGAHTLIASDVDFIIKDATDTTSNFIWRDHSASKLYLGTSDAVVDLRSNLKISDTTRIDTSGNGTFANITSNGSTVLTTADYDTHVCHLKTNINAAVDQGSANEFTVNFNLEEHNDTTTFSHSSGVVTVASAGWYRIYANMVYDNAESSQRNTIRAYVEKNGTEVLSTATYDYDRGSSYGRFSNNKIETMLYLSANDTISIGNYAQNEDGTITIESGECEFIVNSVSVETTSTNCDTVDGLHASSFIRSDANDTATGEVTFTSDIFMNAYLRHTSNPGTHLRFEVDRVLIKAGNIEMIDCVEGTSDYVDIVDRVRVTAGGDLECEGNITAYTTTSISDINQKENIDVIENPIEKIKAISGYTFDWKQSGESSGGVIAQEIEQVMPSIVKETKIRDGDMMKAVDYQAIIGLLVETAKEQQQTIESLTQRIKEIENGNN
jgi:hypothetical protein